MYASKQPPELIKKYESEVFQYERLYKIYEMGRCLHD